MENQANEPEVIRQQMEETRTDLSEKLETLEDEVVESVQSAAATVSETVESAKEAVDDTVETVREAMHETMDAVKSTFNLRHQVEQHPWLMLGGAVVMGYLGGRLLDRVERGRASPLSETAAERPSEREPNWLGEVAETFEPEIAELKNLAVGAGMSVVRDALARAVPEPVQKPVAQTIDKITIRLGIEPIESLLPAEQTKSEPGQFTI